MQKITGWIAAHFDAYRQRRKWPFFWRIWIEDLAVSIVASILLILVVDELEGRPFLEKLSPVQLILVACVWAPLVETALLQTLPVMISRALQARFWIQVLGSVVPFAALHFREGFGVGVIAGSIGGFYLAFTYARWREESLKSAFFMTAGLHALRNGIAVSVLLVGKTLFPAEPPLTTEPTATPATITHRADVPGGQQ
jgi:hypothetical protein